MTIKEFKERFEKRNNKIKLFYFVWKFSEDDTKIEINVFNIDKKQRAFKLTSYNNEDNFIDEKDFITVCEEIEKLFKKENKQ